jgi:hypothetical protein
MGPRIKGSTWIVETGGRGRRFNSLHPHSSFSYMSSGSMISLNPPLPRPPPPFSTCDWLPFVIFRQASLVFALFLFDIRSIESFILLRCFFSSNFFPPRTYLLTYLQFSVIKWAKQHPGQSPIDVNECKRGEPIVCFIGPLKFLKNTWEPPKDFFVYLCFTNTFNRV